MFTRPDSLSDAALRGLLASAWDVDVDALAYRAVGFGSHHWDAHGAPDRWFVTVDDLDAKRRAADDTRDAAFDRLRAALTTARRLRDHGLAFVVAPARARDGSVVVRLDDRFAVALYPYVDGRVHAWGGYASHADRLAVTDLVAAVHDAPADVRDSAYVDDFAVSNRDELTAAMADVDRPWTSGPYAEPCRALVASHASRITRRLADYDRLAGDARGRPERAVLTHGEPHIGNTILTDRGWMLVDWDTALIAPPERDLWTLADGDEAVLDAYETATGRPSRRAALDLYRLQWELSEIAIYVAGFRRPHDRTADVDASWANLRTCVEPSAPRPPFRAASQLDAGPATTTT
jgi:spectinomycin phosphotransferase/16S rRNA (guanine(1405)-N(7))-methyltransferase